MLYGLLGRDGVNFDLKNDVPDLTGKVIFITGGNVGLGAQTALILSQHNPSHIYLSARSSASASTAIAHIKSVNPSSCPITFIPLDLTSFPSITSAVQKFNSLSSTLDILILNAGVMLCPPDVTEQGYEIHFGTNHVGHALLAKLLLPALERAAREGGGDARVVSLASMGHAFASGIDFSDVKTDMSSYLGLTRYAQSKLANVLWAREAARRWAGKGVSVVAVHPGVVNTELYRTVNTWWGPVGWVMGRVQRWVYTGVEEGCKGQVWAATAGLTKKGEREAEGKEIRGKGVISGEYYTPVGVLGQGSKLAYDDELAVKLWEWTEKELEGWIA